MYHEHRIIRSIAAEKEMISSNTNSVNINRFAFDWLDRNGVTVLPDRAESYFSTALL
jgi:hypothetical protein